MFDRKLVLEILEQICNAIRATQKRFEPIRAVNDFTDTEEGIEKLDAIVTKLT
jgi:hypothetical protein